MDLRYELRGHDWVLIFLCIFANSPHVPEYESENLLIAEPAGIFLLCEHLPLARAWYLLFHPYVPREDHFIGIIILWELCDSRFNSFLLTDLFYLDRIAGHVPLFKEGSI